MQASDVIMVYFVIGAVMVGGGALELASDDGVGAGVATYFVEEENGEITNASGPADQIDNTGGAISTVVTLAVGGIVLVWELFLALINFIHWPIAALNQNNAPPMAVLLIGGGFVAAFYMSLIGLLWRAT